MNNSEAWRRETEARYVVSLRLKDRNRALAYLQKVKEKRGEAAAKQLEQEARELWNKASKQTAKKSVTR